MSDLIGMGAAPHVDTIIPTVAIRLVRRAITFAMVDMLLTVESLANRFVRFSLQGWVLLVVQTPNRNF